MAKRPDLEQSALKNSATRQFRISTESFAVRDNTAVTSPFSPFSFSALLFQAQHGWGCIFPNYDLYTPIRNRGRASFMGGHKVI